MNLVPTNETTKNEKTSQDKTKNTGNKLQPTEGTGEETLNVSLGIAYELGQIINKLTSTITDLEGDLHLIVPYTQRRLIKITQGDGDEDSNREHLPRI